MIFKYSVVCAGMLIEVMFLKFVLSDVLALISSISKSYNNHSLCDYFIRRHNIKTLVQCDFDGTITVDDISYGILDKFARGDWRVWEEKYHRNEISVGEFNARVFSMVKTDKATLIAYARLHSRLRDGLKDLIAFCKHQDIEFVIVSNGLDFYIETVLNDLKLRKIKALTGKTEFNHNGITVRYIGPTGEELMSGFKEAYTKLYIDKGYRVVYIGNGISDIPAARLSYRIFARDDLLDHCKEANLEYIPFDDMNDVINGLADIDR